MTILLITGLIVGLSINRLDDLDRLADGLAGRIILVAIGGLAMQFIGLWAGSAYDSFRNAIV